MAETNAASAHDHDDDTDFTQGDAGASSTCVFLRKFRDSLQINLFI
jgi:hypothetical protein